MSMKVLLVTDVKKIGFLGDVVEVKDGYARNYLLPQGLGVIPTEASTRSIAQEKAKRSEQRLLDRKRLQQARDAVDGAEVVLAAKANEQGHLFGSVSEKEIADNLRQLGFEVADEVVDLAAHIKEVGTSEVKLRFADDLKATVKVVVVPLQEEASGKEEQEK